MGWWGPKEEGYLEGKGCMSQVITIRIRVVFGVAE